MGISVIRETTHSPLAERADYANGKMQIELPGDRINRVAGIVLCGGHSRRMGRSKAWLPIGDETFLERIVRVVGEAMGDVIVVAAEGQELPPLPDHVRRVNDLIPDRGPLGGFATGLAAVGPECEAVFLAACDMPHLTSDFVQRIVGKLLASDVDAVVPELNGPHPLAAAYHPRVRPLVERRLAAGALRMTEFVAELRVHSDAVIPNLIHVLRNVNTPEEWGAS